MNREGSTETYTLPWVKQPASGKGLPGHKGLGLVPCDSPAEGAVMGVGEVQEGGDPRGLVADLHGVWRWQYSKAIILQSNIKKIKKINRAIPLNCMHVEVWCVCIGMQACVYTCLYTIGMQCLCAVYTYYKRKGPTSPS